MEIVAIDRDRLYFEGIIVYVKLLFHFYRKQKMKKMEGENESSGGLKITIIYSCKSGLIE